MQVDKFFFRKVKYQLFRILGKEKYFPIMSGKLKGYFWNILAGGNYYLLGTYEQVLIDKWYKYINKNMDHNLLAEIYLIFIRVIWIRRLKECVTIIMKGGLPLEISELHLSWRLQYFEFRSCNFQTLLF